MTVDIYIREKSGTREIRIPLLPEEFSFQYGDVVFITSDIMGLGEVAVPSGTELGSYSWESEFPGALRKNDPMLRGTWQSPQTYRSLLEEWKRKGIKLNLVITGYPVNVDVYCKEFHTKGNGAFGDISYEITFTQAREPTITTTKETSATRPATTSKTYIIKYGDTLWSIAKAYYGSGAKWKAIYNANKKIIEQTAKKYGKKSSENGHWIYPGVTLTIPDITATTSKSSSKTNTKTKTKTKTKTAAEKKYEDTRKDTIDKTVQRLSGGGVNTMERL